MNSLPLSFAEGCKRRTFSHEMDAEEWQQLCLIDKWKASYRNEYIDQSISWWAEQMSIFIFWSSACTELFTFTYYIIPELSHFREWPVFRLCFSVFVAYVFLMATFHWLCTRFVSSSVTKTPTFKAPSGGYRKCSACGIVQPPRTHHCKVCDVCVKKRDHHCFFTGNCIGFWNQRYFVVMNAHVAGASVGGLLFNYLYLAQEYTLTSHWELFLPVTFYNWLILGTVELKFLLMITQMYSLPVTGGMALTFFFSQLYSIYRGKTTHEMRKKLKIQSTASVMENFRSVFGAYWILNLFLPTQFKWLQHGDGINWDNIKIA